MLSAEHAPVVSVVIFTYNHAEYIAEAIDSVLAQKTTFPIEIVIGEDCSTDSTFEICEKYSKQYPDRVRIITSEHNVGASRNVVRSLYAARGKYIACLEGDDYWSDTMKLEEQYRILESNQNIVCCHHWQKIAVRNESGVYREQESPRKGYGYFSQNITGPKEVLQNLVRLKTRTLMFRNVFAEGKRLPDWYLDVRFGDVPLVMFLGTFGDFYFIDEPMAVYRYTGKGVSTAGQHDYLFAYNHNIEWIRIWERGMRFYTPNFDKEALETILYFYKVILSKYRFSFKVFSLIRHFALYESILPEAMRAKIHSQVSRLWFRGLFVKTQIV